MKCSFLKIERLLSFEKFLKLLVFSPCFFLFKLGFQVTMRPKMARVIIKGKLQCSMP